MGKRAASGLKFFFDVCFPYALARALKELDVANEYLHLKDTDWPQNIADIDWIARVSRDQIVVSGDGKILRRPGECDAWLQAGLSGFFLSETFPNKPLWEQAIWVVTRWEKVLSTAKGCRPGDTYLLPWSGQRFEPWTPPRRRKR